MTEGQSLAEMLDMARKLTMMYFEKLSEEHYHITPEADGKYLNSPLWLLAHLAGSENFLCLHSLGADKVSIPWARDFGLGSTPPKKEDYPATEDILNTLNAVHEKAVAYIASLSSEDLDKENTSGVAFGGDKSVRNLIMHAIRHEAAHGGQMGWLCKLNGVKTF